MRPMRLTRLIWPTRLLATDATETTKANEADVTNKPGDADKAKAEEAEEANGLDNQLGGADVVELDELVETKRHDELNELVAAEGHG